MLIEVLVHHLITCISEHMWTTHSFSTGLPPKHFYYLLAIHPLLLIILSLLHYTFFDKKLTFPFTLALLIIFNAYSLFVFLKKKTRLFNIDRYYEHHHVFTKQSQKTKHLKMQIIMIIIILLLIIIIITIITITITITITIAGKSIFI